MKNTYRLLTIITCCAVPLAASATVSVFKSDVERLKNTIGTESSAMDNEETDLKLEEGTELFPDDGTELPPERQGDLGEQKGFVSFRIGDVPYILKDVPTSEWFAPYVRDVAEKGIVSGYRDAAGNPLGIFGPQRNVTVEELAKMAVQAAGFQMSSCPATPKNTAVVGTWSAPYIACAEQHGFAIYGDGTVDPRRPATRAEVVVTVLQAFGRSIVDENATVSFRDVNASTLFAPAIAVAVRDAIVSGYTDASGTPTGLFGPGNPVNRAEVAKILSRSIQTYTH